MGGGSGSSSNSNSTTTYSKTTTKNPYVTSVTDNNGTTTTLNDGTAYKSIYDYTNQNMDSLLEEYRRPSINSPTNQAWAIVFSIGREVSDYYKKVFIAHKDAKIIFEDCMRDLKADLYGLMKAREHGYCSDKVKDVGNIFK